MLKQTCHQFAVQVYTKSVCCTSVHNISLIYKCTQSQFTVQVYKKPVYCTSNTKTLYYTSVHVHKGWTLTDISMLMMKGMDIDRRLLRNVHRWNITKVMLCANCFFAAKNQGSKKSSQRLNISPPYRCLFSERSDLLIQ